MRRAARTRITASWAAQACIALALCAATVALPGPALALSEIQRQDAPAANPDSPLGDVIEQQTLPPADPSATPGADQPVAPGEDAPEDSARPDVEPDEPVPPVLYDLAQLPEPVRRLRERMVEACKSGDIEKLRPYLETGENATQLSFGGVDGDPIAYLKEVSGDKEGAEVMAILLDVLDAGYVHMDAGTPNELYIWPYFFAVPLGKLTPPQRVELFRIVTAGDYEEMKPYGSYTFYRLGITPEGRWSFFVEGD